MIYLNGEFMPIEQAKIPVLDRGFIFGDGVYEVVPVYSGHPFRLDEHMRRLRNSLDAIQLRNPHTDQEWAQLTAEIVKKNGGGDLQVYYHITRGVQNKRDHAFPANVTPTVFLMANPLVTPAPELIEHGVDTVSAEDNRWLRCDIKSISLLANCLRRQYAVDHNAVEVVMFRDGFLTEGSASNVFAVKNGKLLAPPKDNLILPGITYDVVLELAAAHGVACEVRRVTEAEVRSADELWLTSSTKEVLAIKTLDGNAVGAGAKAGTPGPLFRKMHAWYQEFKGTVMRAPAIA
jgi:D-alanine transaminase